MNCPISIWVTFALEGFHCYPLAPEDVSYLQQMHRHLFKFRVEIEVFHDERDIEFHQFLKLCKGFYADARSMNAKSCETLARDLGAYLHAAHPGRFLTVEVSEDGECGSVVRFPRRPRIDDGAN